MEGYKNLAVFVRRGCLMRIPIKSNTDSHSNRRVIRIQIEGQFAFKSKGDSGSNRRTIPIQNNK